MCEKIDEDVTKKFSLSKLFRIKQMDPYEHYLERIKNITSDTDDKAPIFYLSSVFKTTNYRKDNERLEDVKKQNLHLIGKLSDIARSHSVYTPKRNAETYTNNSRYIYRIRILEHREKQNLILGDRIITVTGEILSVKNLNKKWEELLKSIRIACRRKLILPELMPKKSYVFVEKNRPTVYLEVGERNSRPLGRLVILLYLDLAPITCKNFIDLCENHRNWVKPNTHKSNLSKEDNRIIKEKKYVNDNNNNNNYYYSHDSTSSINKNCQLIGTKFTRIFPNLLIYAGQLNLDNRKTNFHGIPDYKPEKYHLDHGYKGTLSMCPMQNNLINSEFTISLKPLHVLNGKRLAFGRVIRGLPILDNISSYGTKNGKPQKTVEILDCGIVNLNLE